MLASFLGARRRFAQLRGAALERYQAQRARSIVAHAMRRSAFYRAHFAGHDLRRWQTLPTVDKAAMMAHFDTFNTRGIRLVDAMRIALDAERRRDFAPTIGGLTVGLSSGTSGHRGFFLVSVQEQAMWAGFLLARALPALRWRGWRIALFLRANSNLYETLGNPWIAFRHFDLATPVAQSVAALNAYQPDIVAGPPSMLGLLAGTYRRGELRIRPVRLVSVAEVLETQDEGRLREVFEVPVHQIYQCTEGLLALSCPQGALHVQEDLVALQYEPLAGDRDGRVTPIVTDLWRRVQPIIRYRLNDVLTLAPAPCRCGSAFRVISRIEGRCDDVCDFVARDGGLRPVFPDALRQAVLLSDPHIEDYRIVQDRPGHVRVHVQLASGADYRKISAVLCSAFAEMAARHGVRPPVVQVAPGLPPLEPGTKLRRVQRRG
jgi:phenylacetate-CoA ligase